MKTCICAPTQAGALAAVKFLLLVALLLLTGARTAEARFLSPDTWDPWLQGVDVNRYAYSGNDSINGSDPNGHGWKANFGRDLVEGISESLSRFAVKSAIETARRQAVREAWRQERALVLKTGRGTYRWTKEEITELKRTGIVKGYDGHHINSVNDAAGLAGNPDNIKFMSNEMHKKLHSDNGGNKVPSKGPLSDRSKTYSAMKSEEKALFDKEQARLEQEQFRQSLGEIGSVPLDALDVLDAIDPIDPSKWIRGAY